MIRRAEERPTETRDALRGGSGSVTFNHYFTSEEMTARTRLCAELVLPPGAGIGLHPHEDEDEIYIITRGSGIVSEAGRETRITAGDAVLTGQGASHALRNDGDEDLKLIAVIMQYPAT